jgi:hypothetical protein
METRLSDHPRDFKSRELQAAKGTINRARATFGAALSASTSFPVEEVEPEPRHGQGETARFSIEEAEKVLAGGGKE